MYKTKAFIVFFLVSGVISLAQEKRVLTLDQALEYALENSPNIQRSLNNLEQNRYSLDAERARLKTNFSLNLTPIDFSRSRQFNDLFSDWYTTERFSYYGSFIMRQPIVMTDGTLTLTNRLAWQNNVTTNFTGEDINNKAYSNNLFLSYNQPLFTYNRTKMQLRELELAYERAQTNYIIQKLTIERNVTQNFYDVFSQQQRLQINEDEYANQVRNYDIVKNKVESGLVAREELYQAEVNVANSESTWKNQMVTVENAKDDFKILLGLNLYDEIELIADIDANYPVIDLETAIDNGLKRRQEIRQVEMDRILAENDMIRTKATNEFRGDLSVSVGIFGEDPIFPQVYETPTNSPSVNLTFAVPLWDWGEKKSRIASQEASLKNNTLDMKDQVNDIIISIRRSYRSLENLKNQISISQKSLESAQLTYDINLERYQNGDITGLELNQYQNQLTTARTDVIAAKINYKLELLNMKIQSLWDFETGEPVIKEEN